MLHDQGAGYVAACWGLVMGGGGDIGVGGVGGLVLGLTAQGERVLIGAVRARIGSLPGRWAICLRLVRVCDVCEQEGQGERQRARGRWRRDAG